MCALTLTVRPHELEQYDITERKYKQLRMRRIKRVSQVLTLPNPMDVEINDSRADNLLDITYDKPMALIRMSASSPDTGEYWVTEVFKMLGERGVAFDMVSIQPQQISFIIQGNLLETVCYSLEKLKCCPDAITNCARVSLRGKNGQPLLSTITAVVEILAQADIPVLRLSESYGLIEFLIEGRYLCEVQQVLENNLLAD